MNTLPSIANSVFRVNPTQGGHQQGLLHERRSAEEKHHGPENQNRQAVTEQVLRGEWLESRVNDGRYQPQYNPNINPQNRTAISKYQSAEAAVVEQGSLGRLIDQYI